MNALALLSLIADLYAQIVAANERVTDLEAQLNAALAGRPDSAE